MKHEWRRHEKELYAPKETPHLISVPKQKFFMIKGKGNPNDKDFSDRIGVLYSLSHAVRIIPKSLNQMDILNTLYIQLKELGRHAI